MPTTISDRIAQCLQSTRDTVGAQARPQVTLCYAQSWDGSLAIRPGQALALSNSRSMLLTHHLRSIHDAILVGIGTVLADDPRLTVRECSGPSPQPIVLDSQLRMPADARLCQEVARRCWVATRHDNAASLRDDVDLIGVDLANDQTLDLHHLLTILGRRGVRHIMVEGGAQVITGFIKARLADAIVLTVAPALVGGYKAVGELEYRTPLQLPRIAPLYTDRLDDDLIMWGRLHYSKETC